MKTIKGKIAPDWDLVTVDIDGKKFVVDTESAGNKSYYIGQEVEGFIVNDKFNIIENHEQNNRRPTAQS